MTEDEWLKWLRARPLLNFMRGTISDRKLRLFACGCCRAYPPIACNPDLCHAVERMEQFVDGLVTKEAAGEGLRQRDAVKRSIALIRTNHAYSIACFIDAVMGRREHAWIARDIFGNPFRPVVFEPEWRSPTAVALAAGIYANRVFDRMPILADALEESGCDSSEVLRHCRGDGPHVRGCWVVDAVLGRK